MRPEAGKPSRLKPFVQSAWKKLDVVVEFPDHAKLCDVVAVAACVIACAVESPVRVVTTDAPVVTPEAEPRSSK
jgi:hypothetical protein